MALLIQSETEPIPGYRLIDRIGGGGFGEVWKAEAPGGLMKAIKVIHGDLRNVDPDGSRHAEQEMKALKRVQSVRHPYLLSLERYDVVEGRLLIVMELADCNLWERFRECRAQGLTGIPRVELLRYMEEASEVLDLMNNVHQLQHLDIKPQNLFLLHNHVKVADFGLVKDLEGLRATITGGVTPVYAAPETFDGVVTRFCDQYSLAIVYQELLTGVRPFAGASVQQLLVQHLQGAPNLSPLPVGDRGIIARCLMKKPEERFPGCMDFVQALKQVGVPFTGTPSTPFNGAAVGKADTPVGEWNAGPGMAGVAAPQETPRTILHDRKSDPGSGTQIEVAVPERIAPPEFVGEGSLLPAIIVGIGGLGFDTLKHFRQQIIDRFGPLDRIPTLRFLYIDTDAEALQTASESFDNTEIIGMRLNRASHYLKPRRNGRSLIEGWFDAQTLYKIPRNPQTLGIRALGRLAFCDYQRTFAAKLQELIELTTHPDAMAMADRQTHLGVRTNRPRIYIVAGSAGGTGSGMFIDAAYTARQTLQRMGYADPEVYGLLTLPPAERGVGRPTTLGNTYATLREVYHYSMPNTMYTAEFESRNGKIADAEPPFKACYVVPPQPAPNKPADKAQAIRRAAEFLRRDMISRVGAAADAARANQIRPEQEGAWLHMTGAGGFCWPKQTLLTSTAHWLGETLISRWLYTDPALLREPVRMWLGERWSAEQLGPEQIIAHLQKACEKTIGQSPDAFFAAESQPFVPRGWFAREPDSGKLWQTLTRLQQLIGMPDERSMQRQTGVLETLLTEVGDQLGREVTAKFVKLTVMLLEHPDYRVVGSEESSKQLQEILEQLLVHYRKLATEMSGKAVESYYIVNTFLSGEPCRKKPSPADIAEHLRLYPKWRYQCLILRQVVRIYEGVKMQLTDQLRELQFCRQRLEEVAVHMRKQAPSPKFDVENVLLPAGCQAISDAVNGLRETISPEDLKALDKKFQKQIELDYQALHDVCMSSVNMFANLHSVIKEQTRAFLEERVSMHEVSEMFFSRYPDDGSASQALRKAYDEAAPPVRCVDADRGEICILGLPEKDREHFDWLAAAGVPVRVDAVGFDPDEILVHREITRFPYTALPQVGPLAEESYRRACETAQGTPHCRTDVSVWADFEAE